MSSPRSVSALLGEPEGEPRNPYKGLRAFTAEDAGDFFGREQQVEALLKAVEGLLAARQPGSTAGRLITLLGPSGSGKSSVVMAGLLPRLQAGALPGSERWVYLPPMVPGQRPIEALTLTLAAHFPALSPTMIKRGLHLLVSSLPKRPEAKVVLFVDQFEELFTQTGNEQERQQFIDVLLAALTEPRGPLIGLLTLRADFYDRPIQYSQLARCIQNHQHLVLPMEVEDLRAAITQPVRLPDVQLTFEGNLVGDLLFEIRGQIGALPLLQFMLDQLFARRRGHLLTLEAYRHIGGVQGALTRQAEETYASLPSEEHRQLTRAVFLRLIDLGASEQDTTRRRAARAEFVLTDPVRTHRLGEVIDTFIAARLLTTNQVAGTTTLEVSHEAVIRAWPRLAAWLQEAREDIQLQQAISKDAAEWSRRGEPVDRLYRGSQLDEALAWSERSWPSRQEEAFLQASAAERERQRQERQRQRCYTRRTLLVGAAGLGLAVAVAAAAGIIAQYESQFVRLPYTYLGQYGCCNSAWRGPWMAAHWPRQARTGRCKNGFCLKVREQPPCTAEWLSFDTIFIVSDR